MTDILTEQSMGDPLIIGLANSVLIEVAKRVPSIPLDPTNKDQVKFVSGALVLLLAVVRMIAARQFNVHDLEGSMKHLVELWLMGWFVSHAAYNAAPLFKGPKPPVTESNATENGTNA